ncbi:MAG: 50S ribosomal protein L24 [Planctomycetes bacterium]|nr:50S ribosomal protein L24 [Planctomycetota bacterium]
MTNGKVKTRIRKNDIVQVIAGSGSGKISIKDGEDAKARGTRGKVISVDREKGRAIVQGVKMVFKHQRASQDPSRPNLGRIEKESPIDVSNLLLVCPKCDEATRIGIRTEKHERENGKVKASRVRVCKKCGADVPERS